MIKAIAAATLGSVSEAQKQMNEYGAYGIPFLFLIDFEQNAPIVLRLDEVNDKELLYNINGISNYHEYDLDPFIELAYFDKHPISYATYKCGFDIVQHALQAGNSYLINLTYPTSIQTNLSLKDIFLLSTASYRVWWKDHFTVFSPETFVRISPKGRIASFPMKGTIDASLPNARSLLLDNPKEKAEHATIVDLLRNDLSMVARRVRVDRYRYLESVNTGKGSLLQSSSEISGELGDDYRNRLGDIIFRLLPAGSISGAPKKKTIEIIQKAEGQKRKYYTGICGIFDGHQLDSGVMIRFINTSPTGLEFRSGGGITTLSKAEEEYQELIQKVYLPLVHQPITTLI